MASSPRENGPGSAQRILHALTFFFFFFELKLCHLHSKLLPVYILFCISYRHRYSFFKCINIFFIFYIRSSSKMYGVWWS